MRRKPGACWGGVLLLALAGCGEERTAGADASPANASLQSTPAAAQPDRTASAAEPAVGTAPMSPTGYALVGTEPFWGGTVTGTSVRYMTPERQFGDVVETRLTFGRDRETYTGTFRGRPFVLAITRGACNDGRSQSRFAFAVTLQVLGETRRGCADPEQ